ncbi:hypothetical protein SteCoe_30685 [Stentor coeruleus]|uniref:Uncharacterized protein n=1 Tax=Stentor coeruleus TaxID=5963 RepID=A0A1R2B363_9CILI|nr:hypothetical protein SteCoe_30685 [Stentor coeruleus]
MSKSFKPISLEILNVGKLIKKSKKHFCWKFELDGNQLSLDLYSSRISGKRTIVLEGNKIIETKASGIGSKYEVPIPKHKVIIYEITNAHFDMQIDYKTFSSTLASLKNNFSLPEKPSLKNQPIKNIHWEKDNFGFPEKDLTLIEKPNSNPQSKSIKSNDPSPTPKTFISQKPQITPLNIFDLSKPSPQDLLVDILSEPLSSSRNPFENSDSLTSSENSPKYKPPTNLIPLLNQNNQHTNSKINPNIQKNLKTSIPLNYPTSNFLTERSQTSLINIPNPSINHNFFTSRDTITKPKTYF